MKVLAIILFGFTSLVANAWESTYGLRTWAGMPSDSWNPYNSKFFRYMPYDSGRAILTCSSSEPEQLKLWSLPEKKLLNTLKLKRFECDKTILTIDQSSSHLVLTDIDGKLYLYSLPDLKRVNKTSLSQLPGSSSRVKISPDGHQIAVMSDDQDNDACDDPAFVFSAPSLSKISVEFLEEVYFSADSLYLVGPTKQRTPGGCTNYVSLSLSNGKSVPLKFPDGSELFSNKITFRAFRDFSPSGHFALAVGKEPVNPTHNEVGVPFLVNLQSGEFRRLYQPTSSGGRDPQLVSPRFSKDGQSVFFGYFYREQGQRVTFYRYDISKEVLETFSTNEITFQLGTEKYTESKFRIEPLFEGMLVVDSGGELVDRQPVGNRTWFVDWTNQKLRWSIRGEIHHIESIGEGQQAILAWQANYLKGYFQDSTHWADDSWSMNRLILDLKTGADQKKSYWQFNKWWEYLYFIRNPKQRVFGSLFVQPDREGLTLEELGQWI